MRVTNTMLARTQEKESVSDAGVYWWKEFRARKIASDEYYRPHLDAPYQEWLIEYRYLCRLPDGRVVAKLEQSRLADALENPRDPNDVWIPWQLGPTLEKVVWEMLGDSSFYTADSLSDTHARLVERFRRLREAQRSEHEARVAREAAFEAVNDFKIAEDRKFRSRRGAKTGAKLDKALKQAIERVKPRLNQLRETARATDAAWENAKRELAEVRKVCAP